MYINPIEGEKLSKEFIASIDPDNPNINKLADHVSYSEARNTLARKSKFKEAIHLYIGSEKGGVGKTSTAIQLWWTLATRGFNVLLIDVDPQANTTSALLEDSDLYGAPSSLFEVFNGQANIQNLIYKVDDGLNFIGGNDNLKNIDYFLRSHEGTSSGNYFERAEVRESSNKKYIEIYNLFKASFKSFDFVIYDTNPSNTKLNRLAMQIADIAIVPFQAKESSAKAFEKTFDEIRESFDTIDRSIDDLEERVKLLFVNNEYIDNDEDSKLKANIIKKIYKDYSKEMFESFIDHCHAIGQASDVAWPLFAHPRATKESLGDIANVTNEVIRLAEVLTMPVQKRRPVFF